MPSWVAGALVGFVSAFFVQALIGHWRLWVDYRKGLLDQIISAINKAADAAIGYYDRDEIPGGNDEQLARDVQYSQKLLADLFGILDRRFGPLSPSCHGALRSFREMATLEGFLVKGVGQPERAGTLSVSSAHLVATLTDWSCGQLGAIATAGSWFKRKMRAARPLVGLPPGHRRN